LFASLQALAQLRDGQLRSRVLCAGQIVEELAARAGDAAEYAASSVCKAADTLAAQPADGSPQPLLRRGESAERDSSGKPFAVGYTAPSTDGAVVRWGSGCREAGWGGGGAARGSRQARQQGVFSSRSCPQLAPPPLPPPLPSPPPLLQTASGGLR
jgi:hypothetical protein